MVVTRVVSVVDNPKNIRLIIFLAYILITWSLCLNKTKHNNVATLK